MPLNTSKSISQTLGEYKLYMFYCTANTETFGEKTFYILIVY